MSQNEPEGQYALLGKKLKALRTRAKESLADASGAVEVDASELANFELGRKRPSQDILLLLISHFGAQDHEALELWESAGYAQARTSNGASSPQDMTDGKIIFTDVVDITVNNYGVVMNFAQSNGNHPPMKVARVGMSREHAKSILKILDITLSQTENPAPTNQTSTDNFSVTE